MTRKTIYVCDRCGDEINGDRLNMEVYETLVNSFIGETPVKKLHLCDKCKREFDRFMKGESSNE